MELATLAKEPTLTKVTVDAEAIVEAYGEPVDFWMLDRQDLPTYLKLSKIQDDQTQMWSVLKDLMLDKDGNKILKGNAVLPIEIMVPVIEKAIQHLGNLNPQTSQ
jgi:hypothetical protein